MLSQRELEKSLYILKSAGIQNIPSSEDIIDCKLPMNHLMKPVLHELEDGKEVSSLTITQHIDRYFRDPTLREGIIYYPRVEETITDGINT